MLAGFVFASALFRDTLKVDDVKVGTGTAIQFLDVIEVQYVGTLTDGKEFDASLKKGKPFKLQVGVGQVIKGWDQGLMGMKVGGERNLTIPPDLGYGDKAVGDKIPANSTLKFNIKLTRILPFSKIEILKQGMGEGLKFGGTLECTLVAKLPNGKDVFHPDNSVQLQINPNPAIFPGLNQAIAGIKAGESRKVTIASELAYGEKGFPPADDGKVKAGSMVPPKSDLVLEIQAVKITQ